MKISSKFLNAENFEELYLINCRPSRADTSLLDCAGYVSNVFIVVIYGAGLLTI